MGCSGYLYIHFLELETELEKLKREKNRLMKEIWIQETVKKIDQITKKEA